MSKFLIVPDMHLPFTRFDLVEKMIDFAKKFKPNYIVQLGDLYDLYSFSKFRRSFNLVSPEEELANAREQAENLWKALKATSRKAECYQLVGNHESRLMKRLLEKTPELESLIKNSVRDLIKFKGVTSLADERDYVEIEGILFMHGFLTGLGKHLKQFNQSVVVGHTHQGGIYFENHKNKVLFELNAGHLADTKSIPLSYMPSKISRSTLGFAIIEDGVPQFRPLE